MVEVRALNAIEGRNYIGKLANVLIDCVEGNASVSFMAPLTRQEAEDFFASALSEVETGKRILLAAFVDSNLVGTVQLVTSMPPNQPHRAEVAKLLVLRAARARGVATLLMQSVEDAARSIGKTLLVLDTVVGGSAEKLYTRCGWTRAGIIPDYALFPDGSWCDTAIFWKKIARSTSAKE